MSKLFIIQVELILQNPSYLAHYNVKDITEVEDLLETDVIEAIGMSENKHIVASEEFIESVKNTKAQVQMTNNSTLESRGLIIKLYVYVGITLDVYAAFIKDKRGVVANRMQQVLSNKLEAMEVPVFKMDKELAKAS